MSVITIEKTNWKSKLKSCQDHRQFAQMLVPLLDDIEFSIKQKVDELGAENMISSHFVENLLLNDIAVNLGFMLSRVCVLEMHTAKENGLLIGDSSEERFQYFVEEVSKPENTQAVFDKYPALKKAIDDLAEQTIRCTGLFIERLTQDFSMICDRFFEGRTDLTLWGSSASGDRHCSGERVMILFLKDVNDATHKLVYKPRSLSVDIAFQHLLAWFNHHANTDFYLLCVLNQKQYGWSEFIEHKLCQGEAQIEAYYQELGSLLAVNYLLNGSDMHSENIIAHGTHPVIVDYECCIPPMWRMRESDDIEVRPMVSNSLILNFRAQVRPDYSGMDISGMSMKENQLAPTEKMDWNDDLTDEMLFKRSPVYMELQQNAPTKPREDFDLGAYRIPFKTGFEQAYRAVLNNKTSVEAVIDSFKKCRVRLLLRNTFEYVSLWMESFHPELLHYADKRHEHFDYLMKNNIRQDHERAFPHEIDEMRDGNVPIFWSTADSDVIYDGNNRATTVKVEIKGVEAIKQVLHNIISEEDLALQLELINYNFIGQWMNDSLEGKQFDSLPQDLYKPSGESKPLEIVDELLQRIAAKQISISGRTCWPTVDIQHDRTWITGFTQPVGLSSGNIGIAYVYACAGELLDKPEYIQLARNAMRPFIEFIQKDEFLEAQHVGEFDGLSGVLKVISLNKTLHEIVASVPGLVDRMVTVYPKLVETDESLDIISGSAGGIMGLVAAKDLLEPSLFKRALQACVDRILDHQPNPAELSKAEYHFSKKPLTGYSHGAAGFATALYAANQFLDDARIVPWVAGALTYERAQFSPEESNWADFRDLEGRAHNKGQEGEEAEVYFMNAWCHGAPGIVLSRIKLIEMGYHDEHIEYEISVGIRSILQQGFEGENSCLCHGALGNFDILMVAVENGYLEAAVLEPIKDRLMRKFKKYGVASNSGVSAITLPGLMVGGAGCAYGLMRWAFPKQLQTVLA